MIVATEDASGLNAVKLLAGVEPLLEAPEAQDLLSSWSLEPGRRPKRGPVTAFLLYSYESEGEFVYSKLHCLITFLIVNGLGFAGAARRRAARSQHAGPAMPPSAPASATPHRLRARRSPAATGTLHGHITDQTGALIPGAQITVSTASGKSVGNATADAAGALSGARPAGGKLRGAGHL